MSWTIIQTTESGEKVAVEHWDTPWKANRAMLLLSAHELRNGRKADFRIHPPIDLRTDLAQFNFPSWVLEVLKKEGLE